jgi:Flp pilus assembly protein TadG
MGIQSSISRRIATALERIVRDERGVSAVEFAMVLPLMMTLYLGSVEVSQGVAIDRKVTMTARTVADLVSRVSSINNADMNNVMAATTAVLSPYSAGNAKVVVSLVTVDNVGVAKVAWSDTLNGTKHAVGDVVTLPTALAVPNTSLVWGEVSYAYTPDIGYMITGILNLKDQIFMRPRLSDSIQRTAT